MPDMQDRQAARAEVCDKRGEVRFEGWVGARQAPARGVEDAFLGVDDEERWIGELCGFGHVGVRLC